MIKGKINQWVGIALLISVICFFYYKSTITELPLADTLDNIGAMEKLQVQLHRDLLRYRNNQIQYYDPLNQTLSQLRQHMQALTRDKVLQNSINRLSFERLQQSIERQDMLVEDFKTHLSILQNSLSYLYNASKEIYAAIDAHATADARVKAELITLLLEYNENPQQDIARRIYPLIDKLNVNPDSDTNALLIHSLIIIERLPEIDSILQAFNTLDTEHQIAHIREALQQRQKAQDERSQIFNSLLFVCSLYLVVYIAFIFISLQKSRDRLSRANNKLNHEIDVRTRTEKALYNLVDIDKGDNDDDEIHNLLKALCKALHVNSAYVSMVPPGKPEGEIIGLLCGDDYRSGIRFRLSGTPCEEVMIHHRLVHPGGLANYFPEWRFPCIDRPESYVGVSLDDKNRKIHGLLAVVDDKPIRDPVLAESILSLATSRAIIALHKRIETHNTQRYQRGLELIDAWIARLITEGINRQIFFDNICKAACEIVGAQLAAFPVISQNEQYHFIAANGHRDEILRDQYLSLKENSLCARAIRENRTLVINDLYAEPSVSLSLCEQLEAGMAMVTPVTIKGQAYGALAVYRQQQDFDDIDEQLIVQFGQSVQMAIINMQLVNDIQSERERAEVTLHSIGDAVITTNVQGQIEYMNQVAENLTAWSLAEVKGQPVQHVFRILDLDTREPIHDVVKSCLDEGIGINKSTLILLTRNDNEKDIESSISPILNTAGKVEGIVIVFHDETQRRQLEKTIQYQAEHDPLTDLLNRDAFDRELNTQVFDARSNDRTHVLCYLDLDRFKLVNDTAGHSAGDQCLIEITSLIQSNIRGDDILGRLGGDEFGLILKNCSIESALKITNNISHAIRKFQFNWEGCDYKLGVSIGIVPLDGNTRDSAEAIRQADLACYTAKDQGRGQVYVYEEQDSELIRRQEETYWASRINEALDNNRIRLYAQPIVPLGKRAHARPHYEILVRLLDADNQLVQPGAFIPAAERYNLMGIIDRRIIYDTFRFIQSGQANGHDACFSINLSGNSLNEGDISQYIADLIDEFDIVAQDICFEITETSAIKNLQNARNLISDLKKIGCQFALDDFGSGLSSFQYLKNLGVDYLKIDGSFVADMVNNTVDQAMVAAINEIGHVMGIKTIAEYVENDQIMQKLEAIGVDYAQGYGIAQPQPLAAFFGETARFPAQQLKLVVNKARSST